MLHLTHIGIVRMKSLARMHVWWPNIEDDIAGHCNDCTACAETGPNLPENMSAWLVPDGPWQRIHIDLAGPFLYDMWLVVMDAYSKWSHVLKLNKYPTFETTTSALDDSFAIWGRLRRLYLTMVHSSPPCSIMPMLISYVFCFSVCMTTIILSDEKKDLFQEEFLHDSRHTYIEKAD